MGNPSSKPKQAAETEHHDVYTQIGQNNHLEQTNNVIAQELSQMSWYLYLLIILIVIIVVLAILRYLNLSLNKRMDRRAEGSVMRMRSIETPRQTV